MPTTEPASAMRTGRDLAQRVLLRTGSGERRELGSDASTRRVESGTSVLWQPTFDRVAATRGPTDQPQTRGALIGADGSGSGLSQAQLEPARRRAPDLPLPAGRAGNQRSGSGLVQRHHLCAD